MSNELSGADLVVGCEAIASFLGIRVRQAEHWVANKQIPTSRMGRTVIAKKSALQAFIDKKFSDDPSAA